MTSSSETRLSTWQLVLLSTGGMLGSGWLFSPYYGFQMTGVWVMLAWAIAIVLTVFIGLSFAEVCSLLPIGGGISRFMGVTYDRNLSFVFLSLGWLSYLVYLPVEVQAAIQYLGFWLPVLVSHDSHGVILSKLGLIVALGLSIGLTWFNTLFIGRVATANSWVSIWKLIVPLTIALFFILSYGKWDNVVSHYQIKPFSLENILLAVTSSGMAFAFTGFQNGLVLANRAVNPKRAVPYSVFAPIIIGGLIYSCLSLAFIACLSGGTHLPTTAVAPLLGLVALFGVHIAYSVLFIDAVIAPLGTANVFTAVTGSLLYNIGRDFLPKSILLKLNRYNAPYVALWISSAIGMCFLLPLPTWRELVDFLSSVVVFVYFAGPISLIILREVAPDAKRSFKVWFYKPIGYIGFSCCGLFIYWSGLTNLIYLSILLLFVVIVYTMFVRYYASENTAAKASHHSGISAMYGSFTIILYVILLAIISYVREHKQINFPVDNVFVVILGFIFCRMMLAYQLSSEDILANLKRLNQEMENVD